MNQPAFYPPPEEAQSHNYIDSEEYRRLYQLSIEQPETFYREQARNYLDWIRPFSKVYSGNFAQGAVRWFEDGQLNACFNCLDRHLPTMANETAIVWEGDEPGQTSDISFSELHQAVCKFANVLKKRQIKKGDRVCIYMPMIPEAAIAMLACARIGAVHSVV
ncbi:MAG: acetyl-coenzyme A synthetase N-terminal domain-containing protein, partial [Gammaproteobacteria bacterium]